MVIRGKYPKSTNSYIHARALNSLMEDMLQLSNKLDKKKGAGGITTEELARERRNHNRRKVEVLNKHIFPAMANLIVLLESMQKSSYIREIFEDDIKALFLGESVKGQNRAPIFQRFLIASVCKKQIIDPDPGEPKSTSNTSNTSGPDFRFILVKIMQWVVCQMIQEAGPHKYELPTFLVNVLYDDLRRPMAWTHLFAQQAKGESGFDRERRPPLF